MAKIVIMGAGLGGVACAYEMKKKVGGSHRVTLCLLYTSDAADDLQPV